MTIETREEWRIRERKEIDTIRARLEKEHGIEKHPKASDLWSLAWEYGHSYGYQEVESYYCEMAELLK